MGRKTKNRPEKESFDEILASIAVPHIPSSKTKKYADQKKIFINQLDEKKILNKALEQIVEEIIQTQIIIDCCMKDIKEKGLTINVSRDASNPYYQLNPLMKQVTSLMRTKAMMISKLGLFPTDKNSKTVIEKASEPDIYDFPE